ncbi:MAG TPA: AlpA family phage regulatory protein [Rhodocyclaceae bacterium]|nr:AlpA family phage regulatory protein [Rhodocyclaceae bacterium]
MLKTSGPVVIMTKTELDALIRQTAKEAAAEALKSFQAWTATRSGKTVGGAPGAAEAPAQSHEQPKKQSSGSIASGDKILRLPDVEQMVGLKKSAIYKLITAGAFPGRIKLGKHASGWRELEVQAWIRARDGKQPADIDSASTPEPTIAPGAPNK